MSLKAKLLCLFVLAMLLAATVAPAAELEGVKISTGTLRMGGVYQAWFYATNWDNNYYTPAQYTTFRSYRARFLFWGVIVPDKVKYFVQLDMVNSPNPFLDYKMMLCNYIPKTTVTVGRFLPNWTLYMPKIVSDLELVYYPMVVSNFAMWRQPGVQTETAIDPVKFYVGCFNGADIPNNTTDNNNAKDFMVRLDAKPKLENMNLLVGGAYWMGRRFVDACHNKDLTMIDIFASLDYQKAKFRGEYMMRTLVEGWDKDPSTPELDDLKSSGFYATAGYTVLDWLEILGRYDMYDPNTDLEDNPATPNFDESEDGLSRITLGLNFMIHKYNAVIALNLVKNMEQYKVSDPSTADPNDTMEFKNDEAIVQFQISF